MNETLCRYTLLAGVLASGLAGLVLPMIRHRLQSGEGSGFVLSQVSDPVGRAVGVAMTVQTNLVGAYAIAFFALGAEVLDVWTAVPGALAYVGGAMLGLAVLTVVTAQAQMGRSWRMCVDEGGTSLVTAGLFRFVRNPIYSANMLFLAGVFVVAPSPWSVALTLAGTTFMAIQARIEEAHLGEEHGAEYAAYAARVGRFFPGLGLIPASATGPSAESNTTAAP